MIFVGYTKSKKAWRCYDPVTKEICETIHVRFDDEATPINGPRTSIPSLLDWSSTPLQLPFSKEIELNTVNTSEMLADIFTKNLPYPRFNSIKGQLGMATHLRGVSA